LSTMASFDQDLEADELDWVSPLDPIQRQQLGTTATSSPSAQDETSRKNGMLRGNR
jgi:hypothetical protein